MCSFFKQGKNKQSKKTSSHIVVSTSPQTQECIKTAQNIHEFHKTAKQQMSSDNQSGRLW